MWVIHICVMLDHNILITFMNFCDDYTFLLFFLIYLLFWVSIQRLVQPYYPNYPQYVQNPGPYVNGYPYPVAY